jgi:hypothetical protein
MEDVTCLVGTCIHTYHMIFVSFWRRYILYSLRSVYLR